MLIEYEERRNKKIQRLNRPLDLATRKLIKDFSLFIKQCYPIAWSVEKILNAKIQKLQGQKTEE